MYEPTLKVGTRLLALHNMNSRSIIEGQIYKINKVYLDSKSYNIEKTDNNGWSSTYVEGKSDLTVKYPLFKIIKRLNLRQIVERMNK